MRENRSAYIKKLLLPCVVFSSLAGVFTALAVFVFKILSSLVIELSGRIYAFVRSEPIYLPLLLLGAALMGLLSWLILNKNRECRGGGIPTAVATLRGFTPLKWIRSAFIMPLSSIITFFVGVPLGNEGPCVQMGTAIGQGTVRIFGKKRHQAWQRYIMTGGACSGFAAATGAPVTGILFAVEEAHRRFSPMLFMVASISVVVGQATSEALGRLTGVDSRLFHFRTSGEFPVRYFWTALIVGLICGIVAIFFTRAYRSCNRLVKKTLAKVPFAVKVIAIFAITAVIGFFSADSIGSGHGLIEALADGAGVWYMLIIFFVLRALMMMLANTTGVTGGLFLPTLAFGAIIGALCGKALVSLGAIGQAQYGMLVVMGMVSFLASASRTPITAIVFAAEALCGFEHILPVAIAVAVSYMVIEIFGIEGFNDTVIEAKIEASHGGRQPMIFDAFLTVQKDAFVVEKEVRDILWPPTCTVLSIEKNPDAKTRVGIAEGDVLHVHYQTFEPHSTFEELERLVGRQSDDVRLKTHAGGKNHQVPEI